MNKISEKMGYQTRLCENAVLGDWMRADLAQKSGAGARMIAPRSFGAVVQTGRSMIEMLGVLAIIGVLTIGGLMGYRYAMNKHKANLILNDVSLAMADLTVQDPDGGAIARQTVAFNPESGLEMESERTEDGNNIVYVNGVTKAVCQILIQIKPTDAYENIYDGDLNALTSCNDNQTMAFGSKDSDVPPVTKECDTNADCGADQVCQDGQCVDKPEPTDPCENVECFNGGTCNEGSCDCIDGYTGTNCEIEPDCNDSKPCTSPKQCENYICVCPKIEHCGMYDDACKCASCDDGYVVDETGSCIPEQTCPEIPFCTAYYEDCSCANCDADHMLQANTCVEVECKVDDDCGTNMTCNDGKCECKDSSYTAVVNYNSDGSKNKFACCEVKEDYSSDVQYVTNNTDYVVVGAINGKCCGGYTKKIEYETYGNYNTTPPYTCRYCSTVEYKIRINGGVPYCADSHWNWRYSDFKSLTYFTGYVADNKWCDLASDASGSGGDCNCSTKGDPSAAGSCD